MMILFDDDMDEIAQHDQGDCRNNDGIHVCAEFHTISFQCWVDDVTVACIERYFEDNEINGARRRIELNGAG